MHVTAKCNLTEVAKYLNHEAMDSKTRAHLLWSLTDLKNYCHYIHLYSVATHGAQNQWSQ